MKTSLREPFNQRDRWQESQVSAPANAPGIENFRLGFAQWENIDRQSRQEASLIPLLNHRRAGKTPCSQQACITIRRDGDVHFETQARGMMRQCANEFLRWTEDSLRALNVQTDVAVRSSDHCSDGCARLTETRFRFES